MAMSTEKKPLSPQDFHALPYNKKLDIVTKKYIELCTSEDLIVNKKMNKLYFVLRRHFTKDSPSAMQCMFDYLVTLDTKMPIDLTTFYQRVEAHKTNLRMQQNKPQETIESYESLLDCLKKL